MLAQFTTHEKRLDKDSGLKSKYTETLKEDIAKGYIIPVKPHDPQLRSAREWYLPQHPALNTIKPGKIHRILNGAPKFHGQFHGVNAFPPISVCLLRGHRGYAPPVWVPPL